MMRTLNPGPSPTGKPKADNWERHARDYYNVLKLEGLVSHKDCKSIDSLFNALESSKTSQETDKLRIELWKALQAEWIKGTYHMRGRDVIDTPKWKKRNQALMEIVNRAKGAEELLALCRKSLIEHLEATSKVIRTRAKIKIENRVAGVNEDIAEYNDVIANGKGMTRFVLRVGEKFGLKQRKLSRLPFDQWILPGVKDYSRIRALEVKIEAEIEPLVEKSIKAAFDAMDPSERAKFNALPEKTREAEISELRGELTAELKVERLKIELGDPETLNAISRAIYDSHFGTISGTSASGDPISEKRDNADKLADALMNFPDPFHRVKDWINDIFH